MFPKYKHKVSIGIFIGVVCWLVGFSSFLDSSLLFETTGKSNELINQPRPVILYFKDFGLISANNLFVGIILSVLGYLTFGIISLLVSFYNGFLLALTINSFLQKYNSILLVEVLLHVPLEIIALSYFGAFGLLGATNIVPVFRGQPWSFSYFPSLKQFLLPTTLLFVAALIEAQIPKVIISALYKWL